MKKIDRLAEYSDDRGNVIEFSGTIENNINILFRGSNNRLVVSADAKIGFLRIDFDCDNGLFEVGSSKGGGFIRINARVGQDSKVLIGPNVSMTSNAYVSSVEGATVTVGSDVMFATAVQVRADDGHPIFDIVSGKRVNPTKDITVGSHVWIGNNSSILGGASIGDGSVIGLGSLVNKKIPNNCIAVGAPAKVVRKNIAWERPHLSLAKPYYKPDATSIDKSNYWNLTTEEVPAAIEVPSSGTKRPHSLMEKIMFQLGYAKIK